MTPPAKPRRRRRLWILLGLAVLAFAGLAWFLLADEAPRDDSDLRIPRVAVPDAENGYLLVKMEEKDVYWPEEEPATMLSGDTWHPELAAEILRKNAEALKRLDSALSLPGFQCEEIDRFDEPSPGHACGAWRQLAEVQQLRAWSLFHDGKEEDALEQALRLVKFGFRIESTALNSLHMHVGLAIERTGLILLHRLGRRCSTAFAHLPRLAESMERLRSKASILAGALRADYRVNFHFIGVFASGEVELVSGPGFSRELVRRVILKPRRTCSRMAEAARLLIEDASVIDHPENRLRTRIEAFVQCSWWDLSRNWFGQRIFEMLYVNEKTLGACLEVNTLLSLTQAQLALTAFQAEKGALLETLDELVPRYLERVPVDPFGGKPIRYSREKRVVYSVGSDYIDSGGSAEERDDDATNDPNEPTLRLGR